MVASEGGGGLERDKLPHTSLPYQMQNGQTARFPEAEICAVVIKAIAPGNFLRLYLESKSFQTVNSLIQRGRFISFLCRNEQCSTILY